LSAAIRDGDRHLFLPLRMGLRKTVTAMQVNLASLW
jgi:hypothetical protein